MIITIDGPAGSGKSTLAKMLAQRLDIAYLDTGAMYRACALALAGLAPESPDFSQKLDTLNFSLSKNGDNYTLNLNNQPLGEEIRTEKAARLASDVAQNPQVRKQMQEAQRAIATDHSIVAEGRDMGTVVFPNADHKFFLEADAKVRAGRRYQELSAKGIQCSEAFILKEVEQRDKQDRERDLDPLLPAQDAIVIDSGDALPEQLVQRLVDIINQPKFSHIDHGGNVHMVDVAAKNSSYRIAKAKSAVRMSRQTLELLKDNALPKGDVLAAAKIAGILAAKKTGELIPLCHPISLTYVNVEFVVEEKENRIVIETEARTDAKTGVEMEALIAAQIAAATIYDMAKAVQKDMVIEETRLTYKEGGKSGIFSNP